MRRLHALLAFIFLVLTCLLFLTPPTLQGQQILQNGFEGRNTCWKAGSSDAAARVLAHRVTDETSHGQQSCEHVSLQIEKGSYIHYTFDIPRAPVTNDLNLTLWLKSNRPGVQLLCRFVLPPERDPDNAGEHGRIAFVDSNTRACALTEHNARSNGVANFEVFATSRVEGPAADSFDVVIANPPYFARGAVAHLFLRRAKELLTPQGRLFVVTRQPQELAELLVEVFGEAEVVENRGYAVFCV